MLTNIEAKEIIKVTSSLENTGTTRKINSQRGGLLNFLASLTTVALP